MIPLFRDETLPNTDELLYRCRRLVSPVTGIVRDLHYGFVEEGDPLVFQVASAVGNTKLYNKFGALNRFGGVGLTREDAY